jgi:hypothetical protein
MTDPLDVDPGEQCPICGEDRDDCYEHLLANFGITEPDIGGGLVFDFTEDVDRLLIAFVTNSDMHAPDSFGPDSASQVVQGQPCSRAAETHKFACALARMPIRGSFRIRRLRRFATHA